MPSTNDNETSTAPQKGSVAEMISKYLGYFLLVGCIAFWQAMGVVLQDFGPSYPQHYFTTWAVHNGFISSLLVWVALNVWYYQIPKNEIMDRLTDKRLLKITAMFSVLSLTGTCLWYYSLEATVLSANNAIYQTVPVFVFLMSIKLLGEKVTRPKVVALGLEIIGITLVTLFTHAQTEKDGQTHSSTPVGYLFCILSVFCYAFYEVCYAVVERNSPIPEEERNDVMESFLFVGLMGVFNLILLLPGMFLVKAVGLEVPFEFPPGNVGLQIALVAMLETGFHMFLLAGIAVMGPVFMAIGQILIIPTGYVYDAIQGGSHSVGNYVGVIFIILGFLVMQEFEWTKQCTDKVLSHFVGNGNREVSSNGGSRYAILSEEEQEKELSSVM